MRQGRRATTVEVARHLKHTQGRRSGRLLSPMAAIRIGEAKNPGPRLRARGPRSQEAAWKRRAKNANRVSSRNAKAVPPERDETQLVRMKQMTILQVNLQGFVSHNAEVVAMLRNMKEKPMIIIFNETFLTQAIEDI